MSFFSFFIVVLAWLFDKFHNFFQNYEASSGASTEGQGEQGNASPAPFQLVVVSDSATNNLLLDILKTQFNTHPQAQDVTLGRGQPIRDLEGNHSYRNIIEAKFPEYLASESCPQPRIECSRIVNSVFKIIHARQRWGRRSTRHCW